MIQRAILAAAILMPEAALAQAEGGAEASPKPNPATGANLLLPYNPLARPELWLSVACILFGLVVLLAQFAMLRKATHFTADDIVRNSTITIVVVGALVLIIAGYDSQQTAQAFGLFGTIVGYLLGRTSNRSDAPATPSSTAPASDAQPGR